MSVDGGHELKDLRHHWGSAYVIGHPAPDIWIAQRRDNRETLHADDPELLRDKIRADSADRPVSVRLRRAAPRRGSVTLRPIS